MEKSRVIVAALVLAGGLLVPAEAASATTISTEAALVQHDAYIPEELDLGNLLNSLGSTALK